jgi:hypothetical protein
MATLKQVEKMAERCSNRDEILHDASEIYCMAYCKSCDKLAEPYNSRFLGFDEDSVSGERTYRELVPTDLENGTWVLFGAACAKRVLGNGGVGSAKPM